MATRDGNAVGSELPFPVDTLFAHPEVKSARSLAVAMTFGLVDTGLNRTGQVLNVAVGACRPWQREAQVLSHDFSPR